MPKPRHRQPDACEQQWLLWTVMAVAVPLLLTVMTREMPVMWLVVPTFALFLLCFFAGSASGMAFLAREAVIRAPRTQPVRQTEAVNGTSLARHNRNPVAIAPDATSRLSTEDIPRFASSRDADKMLQVAVLVSADEHRADPADGAPFIGRNLGATGAERRAAFPEPLGGDGSAPPPVTVELVEPGPYPGSILAMPDRPTPPGGYRVKGNTRSMIYHTEQSPNFNRTKTSVWFRSVADAEKAGFSPWNRRTQFSKA